MVMFKLVVPFLVPVASSALNVDCPKPQAEQCYGCLGGAFVNASAPSANCPGAGVSITVMVHGSDCTIEVIEPFMIRCKPETCTATVTRAWTGVNPGSELDFCVKPPASSRLCLDTDPLTPGVQGPLSGNGTGSTTIETFTGCGDGTWRYSITAECGGSGSGASLTATAAVTCDPNCK